MTDTFVISVVLMLILIALLWRDVAKRLVIFAVIAFPGSAIMHGVLKARGVAEDSMAIWMVVGALILLAIIFQARRPIKIKTLDAAIERAISRDLEL